MDKLASANNPLRDTLPVRLTRPLFAVVWLAVVVFLLASHLLGSARAQSATDSSAPSAAPAVADAPAKVAAAVADGVEQPVDALSPQDAAKLGSDWVRLKYGDDGQLLGMQTAIVRYASAAPEKEADSQPAPVEVDLIGAIHIGDAAYYQELNRLFKQYDALLYELVAPDGTVVPRGRGTSNRHILGAMQNGMKNMLALEHQLEQIDYTQPNFVHADMSPDQFSQAMKDRGEGFWQMYFHLLGESMAQQSEMSAKGESFDMDLLTAMFSQDRARRLKVSLAKQLADVEGTLVSFGGEQGSVLISERNKAALQVLKEQIKIGKKHLGIFYGAGHLTDMDHRLRQEFGLHPVGITWLTAWNLAPGS
jgi:hypothetical protein